jgi:hypothetical protein
MGLLDMGLLRHVVKESAGRADGIEDGGGVLDRRLLPREVAGIQHDEAAVGDPLVQELSVGEGNDVVVPPGDDRDRGGDLSEQLGARTGSSWG